MQKLNYQWTQEDALHYYELLLSTAHETRLTRMISILWGPALSVALMIRVSTRKFIDRLAARRFLFPNLDLCHRAKILPPSLQERSQAQIVRKRAGLGFH